jgi:3-isopropylmalate dehydrogenase
LKAKIAVLGGDGIGPEVVAEAVQVLELVAERYGHSLTLIEAPFGGVAIDSGGDPLPGTTLDLCLKSDAILLGAIGGPKWSTAETRIRPDMGLLRLDVFANLRPVKVHPALHAASTLRSDVLTDVDLVFVRELTGGIYFGEKKRDALRASDLCTYTVAEVERVTRIAARLAQTRRKRLTSIDKSNVLETSRLWREVVTRVMRQEFSDVHVEHMLVDAAAMHLIRTPRDFDVMLTENMFGDILSDEASMLAGSLGLPPSASIGLGTRGLYEPIHGSAPDIAGRGIANPIGTILSVAMLLRHSLQLEDEALAVELAVSRAIDAGLRTADIRTPDARIANTQEAGTAIRQMLQARR